jgi:hypothetical protein
MQKQLIQSLFFSELRLASSVVQYFSKKTFLTMMSYLLEMKSQISAAQPLQNLKKISGRVNKRVSTLVPTQMMKI